MKSRRILAALVVSVALGSLAISDASLAQERGFRRRAAATETLPAIAPTKTISYGTNAKQALDFWRARPNASAPLIIFVHGGGWQHGSKASVAASWKVRHFLAQGYNVAAVDYRLFPGARVEDQAADIAAAIKMLRVLSRDLGVDPNKVVLMGHSAGAHLVALVGTDQRYLRPMSMGLNSLRGVVAIDGAAYDVPRQMTEGPPLMQATYESVFSLSEERQRALSPLYHASEPNAGRFFIMHVQRPDGIAQSNAFAAALTKSGTEVELLSVPGEGLQGHAEINRRLGDPSYAPTTALDQWLRRVFSAEPPHH